MKLYNDWDLPSTKMALRIIKRQDVVEESELVEKLVKKIGLNEARATVYYIRGDRRVVVDVESLKNGTVKRFFYLNKDWLRSKFAR